MYAIERLRAELAKRFPEINSTIDQPENPAGSWFLDMIRAEPLLPIVIEWRDKYGFGVSTPTGADSEFGEGPDEIYPTHREALERVCELVETNGVTSSGKSRLISDLRLRCGISQTELAERLGITQAAIARIEGRDDVRLSTVSRLAKAMGVELSIHARLPSGEVREISV